MPKGRRLHPTDAKRMYPPPTQSGDAPPLTHWEDVALRVAPRIQRAVSPGIGMFGDGFIFRKHLRKLEAMNGRAWASSIAAMDGKSSM